MTRAAGADDPALAETSWPLPDLEVDADHDTLESRLRFGDSTATDHHAAADILAAYRALICDGTTTDQVAHLRALRRVWRRREAGLRK